MFSHDLLIVIAAIDALQNYFRIIPLHSLAMTKNEAMSRNEFKFGSQHLFATKMDVKLCFLLAKYQHFFRHLQFNQEIEIRGNVDGVDVQQGYCRELK